MHYYDVIFGMKAISVRLDDRLGKAFDEICAAAGYKKNTLLTRLIAAFVRYQKGRPAERLARKHDPFEAAIGVVSIRHPVVTNEDIDRVVYTL